MSDWQPIETAPKDGTRILIAAPSYYDGTESYVFISYFETFAHRISGCWNGLGSKAPSPTHWRQIPAFDLPVIHHQQCQCEPCWERRETAGTNEDDGTEYDTAHTELR